jgi:hypothetical protein
MITLDDDDLEAPARPSVSEELKALRRMAALLETLLSRPAVTPEVHVAPPVVNVPAPQVTVKAPIVTPTPVTVQSPAVTVNPHQPIRGWELIVTKLSDGTTKVVATALE